MRTLILAGMILVVSPAFVWAGTGSCTFTDADGAKLAAQFKVQPAQVCQALLDQRIKALAQADMNVKLNALNRACHGGDKAACSALDTAAKAAPAPKATAPKK